MNKNDPTLPISDKPFWDRNQEEEGHLNSVAESCVLLQSLKQSRERWLFKTFPKFSSKSRGSKGADVTPPPHTIQTRGRCDLEVGPHIFPDTLFYEVHYLPTQVSQSTSANQTTTANPYWQTSFTPSYSYTPAASTPQPVITVPPEPEKASTPFMSSITSVATVTPGLISQVNAAASSNPILANLLQLAAAGKATADQLKTLGLLIQSLANIDRATSSSDAASSSQQHVPLQPTPSQVDYYRRMPTVPPVKEFDVVIEFRETPNDRWLFPRGPVYAERKPRTNLASLNQDISLLTCLPFDETAKSQASGSNAVETPLTPRSKYPVTLTLKDAPATVWDTIYRWTGGEDRMNANKGHIEGLVVPPRLYLGHQLPPGPTLAQLQQACAPPYTMKTLKQGPTTTHNRAPRKRTNAQRKGADNSTVQEAAANTTGDAVVVKRPRASKPSTSTPIQCHSCKQTDVPLIMGGRFCRPCAEKQTTNVASSSIAVQPPVQPVPSS